MGRFPKLIRNTRFLKRVFSKEEIAYCKSKKNKGQHFAVRFAAKEAVWKAMSDVFQKSRNPVSHTEISIRNTTSGKPTVILPARFSRYKKKILVSLSHSRTHVVAMALLKG